MLLLISLALIIYLALPLVSAIIGNQAIYHRASCLREVLSLQNFINTDVLYLNVLIDVMLSMGIMIISFLTSSSNHFIMSLSILFLLRTLLTSVKYPLKKSETLPVK